VASFYLLEDKKMCQLNCKVICVPPVSGTDAKVRDIPPDQHKTLLITTLYTENSLC